MTGLLEALGIQELARPWLVPLLWLGIAALGAVWLRARPPSFEWPDVDEARAAGARRVEPRRALGVALRLLCLAALAVVLAGPLGVHRAPPEPGHGLDMTLVVDASGSMRALDTQQGSEWRTRLDLAREVVARFARERAAEGDRVALVVFGESAFTQCPLTSDGAILGRALARVEAGMAGEATALGQALGLAVKRALGAGAASPAAAATAPAAGPATGRLVVLLTDGRHNAGAVSVEVATQLAVASGVRVHTVAIGSEGEEVPVEGRGGALHFERHDVDAASLEAIAAATGGRFFRARRSRDLGAVYAEIDALERVARPRPPRVRHTERPEPLLALAGGLLLCEVALLRLLRRPLP
ncbi:MAG: VWA domain-containing protein [Myxococcota bacterium]